MKAIIFDLDGVLVSTDELHYQAWKKLADRIGVYFDREINHRLRGVGRMDCLEIILERYEGKTFTPEEKLALAEEKNNTYRELLKTMSPADVAEEVRETLRELRRRGYKLGLGSASKNAGFILEQTGLKEYLDKISDGNNITKSKPDPEVFLKAAEFLGEEPLECLVVEDAEAGIRAGISGGMKTAAIGDAVKCGLADYTLETFSELLTIA